MSPERREAIEAQLTERLAHLRSTRAAMHRSAEGMKGSELSTLDNHPGDLGTQVHDEELDETTDLLMDEEERRVAEARRALADGTYGTCRECGSDIPDVRLAAVPEAVRCLGCQRRFEGWHRQRAQA